MRSKKREKRNIPYYIEGKEDPENQDKIDSNKDICGVCLIFKLKMDENVLFFIFYITI